METADRIKGKSMKREQVSATGKYQPTIGRKRPNGGFIEQADKKPKELGKQLVLMRIQWTPMGQGKSEEHPSYEESTV
ncbi:hypothetical protein Taro_050859 [Colocasia esculenta]|uniref:Uncharacterized protein n=1 Tax=Colocasia esculenta TaxID=4460 RepID=A0A843XFE5_COLES|nr:hypothetical protein [Colocasia esculenta]